MESNFPYPYYEMARAGTLQEISSQPSHNSFFFLTPIVLVLDRNDNSYDFFVLTYYFRGLVTSMIFNGYTGIQNTNEMDVCCPNHSYYS